MRFNAPRVVAGITLSLCTQTSLVAQEKVVSVPFIGCKSDGQAGPLEVPKGTSTSVPIGLSAAQKLAYYSAFGQGSGVLAPRGWYCFGIYGSGGSSLSVSPQPIDSANRFSPNWTGFAGPGIEVSNRDGGTSGRFEVAEIIARVFPAYRSFATSLEQSDPAGGPVTFGPYPTDVLTYKGKKVVEYETPPLSEGLGTYHSSLKKNERPINGVAMLVGQPPSLSLLSVRLPPQWEVLTSVIIRQFEREAETRNRH